MMSAGTLTGREIGEDLRDTGIIGAEAVNRYLADLSRCLRPPDRRALVEDLGLFKETGCLTTRVTDLFRQIEFLAEADRIMDRRPGQVA